MSTELELHPLINKTDSPHYDSSGEETSIERFERKYTVTQLMNWAEITKAKYDDPGRKNKGEAEADVRKSATYYNYYQMLRSLILKYPQTAEMSAEKAYKHAHMKWRYS